MLYQHTPGQRLTLLRLERGYRQDIDLTQADVANDIGVPRQKVSYWEKGREPVSEEWADRLATYYNTTKEFILHGSAPEPEVRSVLTRWADRLERFAEEMRAEATRPGAGAGDVDDVTDRDRAAAEAIQRQRPEVEAAAARDRHREKTKPA